MRDFLPDMITRCLQFHPEHRCNIDDLHELVKKSIVGKLVGAPLKQRLIGAKKVRENFMEELQIGCYVKLHQFDVRFAVSWGLSL
jgi:hypothetical protein